jgi:hypothetical protein
MKKQEWKLSNKQEVNKMTRQGKGSKSPSQSLKAQNLGDLPVDGGSNPPRLILYSNS